MTTELRSLLAAHKDAKDLIEIGAYQPGTNPLVDRAITLFPKIEEFLRQAMDETSAVGDAWLQLEALLGSDMSNSDTQEVSS